MKLSQQDADLFFKLMLSLQFYVNSKMKIHQEVKDINAYQKELTHEGKFEVRGKLFENPDLIISYVESNPDQLTSEELSIVRSWRHFIKGDFYIERYLKKHAIFIKEDEVYAVLALHGSFDQFVDKSYLPRCIKTVLLPFKGQIIYDGLMQQYNIFFGSHLKRELREIYLTAKQNDKIIYTLEKEQKVKTASTVVKDWRKEINKLSSVAKNLKGGADQPVINSHVFSLVKSTIELANRAIVEAVTPDEIEKELKKVERALNKLTTVVYRME